MTGQLPNKLRKVRCPKCRCVLPELPNVPIYQCGGCGTVLEAKKRNITSGDAEPLVTESVPVQTNEPENICSDEVSENFSQEATLSLTGHQPVETDCESSQTEVQVCSGEPPLDSESSPETDKHECVSKDNEPSTGFTEELIHHVPSLDADIDESVSENCESSTVFPQEHINHTCVEESTSQIDKDEFSRINEDDDGNKNKNNRKEKPNRRVSFSDEFVYSTEPNHLEDEDDGNETYLGLKSNEDLEERVLNNNNNKYHLSPLKDMNESPMTRSYYGFYGSGSSCDGTDDQISDGSFHQRRTSSERQFTHGKFIARNGDVSEVQGQNGYFSSSPLYPCGQGVRFSNGNYSNDEMKTNFKREYLEVEKMELLKKVHELQDELNRTYISEGKQNRNQVHQYHHDFPHKQEYGRYHEGRSRSHLHYADQPRGDIPLHSYEAKSDMNKVRAERLYMGKKHVLPRAGGAPFLLCYGCSEVLQMPADFLLFKRKNYHKLKCGSCSVALKYSLLNRNRIVVYMDHSCKDVEITVSVDDDYEPSSVSKSFSTKEASSSPMEPQFDELKRNSSVGKVAIVKKENRFTSFLKTTIGSVRSSSTRSKAESSSSESEQVPASANSPLHRLMGYDTATFLLKADG